MEHIRWLAEPTLRNPVVVAAFTGWNDAGDAASTALRTLVESCAATALAEIDPDPYTDFATVRPHVRLTAQRQREIVWPTVGVWSASLPGTDVILVLGPEPALRWRSFCEQITGLAAHLGAPMAITLGALLADVPHSRPVHLIGTATDMALMERYELERSRYEGPDRHRRGAPGGVHAGRHPRRVAVGRGARLRRTTSVTEGGDGTRRAGLFDDGHPRPGLGAGRPVRRIRRADRVTRRRRRRSLDVRVAARVDARRTRPRSDSTSRVSTSSTAPSRNTSASTPCHRTLRSTCRIRASWCRKSNSSCATATRAEPGQTRNHRPRR